MNHPNYRPYDATTGKAEELGLSRPAPAEPMTAPWEFPDYLKSLEALLGSRGVMTSRISSEEHALFVANQLFKVNARGLVEAQELISLLPKNERRRLFRENINALPSSLVSSKKWASTGQPNKKYAPRHKRRANH